MTIRNVRIEKISHIILPSNHESEEKIYLDLHTKFNIQGKKGFKKELTHYCSITNNQLVALFDYVFTPA